MIRYSNGNYPSVETKTVGVYVNGTGSLPGGRLEYVANLDLSLALQSGTNTITFQIDADDKEPRSQGTMRSIGFDRFGSGNVLRGSETASQRLSSLSF